MPAARPAWSFYQQNGSPWCRPLAGVDGSGFRFPVFACVVVVCHPHRTYQRWRIGLRQNKRRGKRIHTLLLESGVSCFLAGKYVDKNIIYIIIYYTKQDVTGS